MQSKSSRGVTDAVGSQQRGQAATLICERDAIFVPTGEERSAQSAVRRSQGGSREREDHQGSASAVVAVVCTIEPIPSVEETRRGSAPHMPGRVRQLNVPDHGQDMEVERQQSDIRHQATGYYHLPPLFAATSNLSLPSFCFHSPFYTVHPFLIELYIVYRYACAVLRRAHRAPPRLIYQRGSRRHQPDSLLSLPHTRLAAAR